MSKITDIYDNQTRILYRNLLELGLEFFIDEFNERGFRRTISHIQSMITHFEEKEEYEKCTTLREFLSLTKILQEAHIQSPIIQ